MIDDVIEEPLGGAHRDHPRMAARLKMYLHQALRELTAAADRQTAGGCATKNSAGWACFWKAARCTEWAHANDECLE